MCAFFLTTVILQIDLCLAYKFSMFFYPLTKSSQTLQSVSWNSLICSKANGFLFKPVISISVMSMSCNLLVPVIHSFAHGKEHTQVWILANSEFPLFFFFIFVVLDGVFLQLIRCFKLISPQTEQPKDGCCGENI